MFRRLSALIIVSSFLVTVCSSAEIDFRSFEFFGFTISDTQEMVLDKLNNKEVEPRVANIERENYIRIQPSNQYISEGQNLDYSIGFFRNRMMAVVFFDRNRELLDRFLKDEALGPPEISTRMATSPDPSDTDTSYTIYTWIQNEIKVICTINDKIGNLKYHIFNLEVKEQYDQHIEEMLADDPYY